MGAFDDLVAARKAAAGNAPEAPSAAVMSSATAGGSSGGGAFDALMARRRGGSTAVAAPPSGNPFVSAGKSTLSNVGKALDAQRFYLWKGAGLGNTTDEQMTNLRHKLPGADFGYEIEGRIPFIGHAMQGLTDTALQIVGDPLTYETGVGGIARVGAEKALGLAPGALRAGPAILKAMNATPLGRKMYDIMNWGGKVDRTLGPDTTNYIRGADFNAATAQSRVQDHLVRRFNEIVNGAVPTHVTAAGKRLVGKALPALTDEQKIRVGKALNGEVPIQEAETGVQHANVSGEFAEDPERAVEPPLSPREMQAYRQLRALTETDYRMRYTVARDLALKSLTSDLTDTDRATLTRWMKQGKPDEAPKPAPRVRQAVGEPQPRSRMVPGQEPLGDRAVYDAEMAKYNPEDQDTLRRAYQAAQGGGLRGMLPEHAAAQAAIASRPDLQKSLEDIQEAVKSTYIPTHGRDFIDLAPKPKTTFQPANKAALDNYAKLLERYDTIKVQLQHAVPHREDYMPWSHELAQEEKEGGLAARPYNELDPAKDMRAEPRADVTVTKPEQLDKGFEALAGNAGRVVKSAVLRSHLANFLENDDVRELFQQTMKATGNKRNDWEQIKDGWMALVGYPRAATVSFTPRHAVNILDLALNTVPPKLAPQYLKDTMTLAAKLANPKITARQYAELTEDGRELGVHGGTANEKKPFFQTFPEYLPWIGGKSTGPLGKWTQTMNRLTWAVDAAAKQEYAKILVKQGEAQGLAAGGLANKRLVDYDHLSPLQKLARTVAPFGTFRAAIPGAVLGGIARNPARAAAYNRLSGGTMYGGKPDQGQSGLQLENPTADVGRLFNYAQVGSTRRNLIDSGPGDYARATAAAPLLGGLGAAQDVFAPGGDNQHWAMYGQPWLPKRLPNGKLDTGFLIDSAVAGIPEARTLLEAMGFSRFKQESLGAEGLRQALGVQLK